jgi:ABC-2 type transport system permease protein
MAGHCGKFIASWVVLILALALTFRSLSRSITLAIRITESSPLVTWGACCSPAPTSQSQAMTSAMTRNQVVSFILSVVLCLFLILAGWPPVTDLLVRWANPWFVQAVSAFSVMTHFEAIQKGVLDSRDILYFISVIVFCLFTTSVILRAHRAG